MKEKSTVWNCTILSERFNTAASDRDSCGVNTDLETSLPGHFLSLPWIYINSFVRGKEMGDLEAI